MTDITANVGQANTGTPQIENPAQPVVKAHPVKMALQQKTNVMRAVILRDMRTRFFNHGLGFLLVPLWPFCHLFVLLAIYSLIGRQAPFGDNLELYIATGLLPTLTFMYVTRFMSMSMMSNRPMLAFPVVRLLDIVLGRAVLEIVGALLTAVMVLGVLWAIGANPVPVDPMEATLAFIVVAAFSTGMGIAVSCVVMKLEFFATVWAVFSIVIYLLSGTIFTISYLPAELIDILSWNPLLHATEWMRSAFFIGYPSQVLDKTYLLGWTVGSIVLGLVCERVFRAGLLSS